jgi:hypothetical protein
MSKASEYGVRLMDRVVIPAIDRGRGYEPPEPSDLIAYALQWGESQGFDPYEEYESGLRHFEAERGEGDDIANDPTYDDMIGDLP